MKDLGRKVVYQIYPRSFQDSDGNGIGDLRGITTRLDYLKALGVDLLWLTPVFVSPQNDNGYDVANYREIDPLFGTMDDFDELIAQAHQRNMGIMLDMVFNHTSTHHEWFQRALAGEEHYQRYYFFRDGTSDRDGNPGKPPTNWVSKFGGSAWEWVPSLKKWYLHLFDVSQADLNWDNPEVRHELKEVIRFWRAKGIEGFRFDVVNLISKPDPTTWIDDLEGDGRRFYTDGPHVHDYLRELSEDTGLDELVTVGEMSSTSISNCIGYSAPRNHELSMAFSFHHLKVDYAHGDKWALAEVDHARLRELFRTWQEEMTAGDGWNALFWDNHDQPRAVSRFGCDSDPLLWRASAKMLATCIFMMRGTPYIYQGDELGMTNAQFVSIDHYRDVESLNYYKILCEAGATPEEALHVIRERSRDNGRTPMQWDATEHAGFTEGTPWIGIPDNHSFINAASEENDPTSPLAYFRRLVDLRHTTEVIAEGDVHFVDLAGEAEKVICFSRNLTAAPEDNSEPRHLLCMCSFSDEPVHVDIPSSLVEKLNKAQILISGLGDGPDRDESTLSLRPYESVVYSW